MIGIIVYYFAFRYRRQAYANIRKAFVEKKSPDEIKQITKDLFKNYGQNFIELFRMPLMNRERFGELIEVQGKENIDAALKKGRGVILLAMHFGSWEIASLSCGLLGYPYKMFANPQAKHSRLDGLLNSYRSAGGSVILSEGMGPRDFVRSLKNNEVIGMVVDQGGKEGVHVPFFGRKASMSVGAIRMGLKMDVPICFSVIVRQGQGKHRMIIHPPLALHNSGNQEQDIKGNLKTVIRLMQEYIIKYPSEYMWFYKIWKYSRERKMVIISDGKTGHLRQSETTVKLMSKILYERDMPFTQEKVRVCFKSKLSSRVFSIMSRYYIPFLYQGQLGFLKWFLTKNSFEQVSKITADYIISCGSSVAGLNNFLASDYKAKSIVILRPGLLDIKRFDLAILPKHDIFSQEKDLPNIAATHAAPNLITKVYIQEQRDLLLNRFSHLKTNLRFKIGVFIGGNAKDVFVTERQIKILSRQLEEVARELKVKILITTSRRTPQRIEQMLHKQFKKNACCPLLILANQDNVPEAVGGILGLSDLVVVSGDSISMVSEAASSGKSTIVFSPETRAKVLKIPNKHQRFIDRLNERGFIRSTTVQHVGQAIYDLRKNKMYTRILDDNKIILEAVRKII